MLTRVVLSTKEKRSNDNSLSCRAPRAGRIGFVRFGFCLVRSARTTRRLEDSCAQNAGGRYGIKDGKIAGPSVPGEERIFARFMIAKEVNGLLDEGRDIPNRQPLLERLRSVTKVLK